MDAGRANVPNDALARPDTVFGGAESFQKRLSSGIEALGILRTRDLSESNEPPMRSFDDFTHCFCFLASMPVVLEEKLAGRSIPITWVYKGRIALPLKSRQNCVVEAAGLDKSGDETHQAGMSL